ncbi:MAG: hypothetical protein JW940_24995 [Polyangiaceae bacterium]|nr:hypothetical protein [Polyangiaceae bacterium]
MTKTVKVLGSFALLAIVGCEYHARSPEQYRDDTQTLIQGNAPAIEQCYTAALQQDQSLAGQVRVTFVVEPETGRIVNPQADPSAPPALGQCVVQVLGGLTLAPPDEREGQVTWTFEFQPRPTPAVSAAPAEPEPAAQAPAAAPAAPEAAAAAQQAPAAAPATATATTPQ